MKKLGVVGVGIFILLTGWFAFKHFSHNHNKSPKLILLGLDGADWDIIDHYIAQERLPTFARLKSEGAWGYLKSFEPMLSPMLWTTIATGKRPDEHGIVDFLEWNDKKKERLPVTSKHRRVPAIWNILNHHGLHTGVFNWLVSWPAEKVNGVLVSDRLGYHIFPRVIGPRLTLEQVSYPREYAEKKKGLFNTPENITHKEISEFLHISKEEFNEESKVGQYDVQNPDMNLRLALSTFKTFKNFALDFWKGEKPSFLALYFDIPDTLMHTFMDYAPPKLERVSLIKFQKYKNAVLATYEKLDDLLAEILKNMDAQTHLMIVSDHGFKFGKERPNFPATIGKDNEVHWHDNEGIIVFWGARFQERKQILAMNLYDIVPTILQFFNLPIAKDLSGKVVSEAFKSEFFNLNQMSYIASYNDVPFGLATETGEQPERSKEVDQSIKEKLASLGYIQFEEEEKQKNRYQTRNPFLEAIQLQKAGRIDEAVKLYLDILKKEPDTKNALSIYNSLALIYRNRDQYQNAKKYIQKAIQKEKNLSSLYINLGNIEKQFGYHTKAFMAYKRAIEKDPKDGMAYYALGLLFEEQKKWDQAAASYREALNRKLDVEFLPNRLMNILEKQHKTAELEKMYEQFALQKSPEDRFNFFIGENQRYIQENRLKEALEALFEALRLQPKSAIVYNDIGGIFLKQNNKTKAMSYFKRALELDPGYVLSHLNLASTYLESGQPTAAEEYLQKALKLDPQNKHAYYLLGLAQMRLQKHRFAKFNFEKVLKIDPGFTDAKEKLAQLRKRMTTK